MFGFNRSSPSCGYRRYHGRCNRYDFGIYNSIPCIPCNGISLNWKKGNASSTITPYSIEGNASNLPSSVTVDPIDMIKHVV